ncbi:Protein of unknown function [Haladaptatus litoreus]|uniref:DUF3891 domain-containing protein n=1 Tax=Haladaptatus litoreus TaxID=553468 RepID=A0A1N7D1B1_9EURY|nr:DUF3891 family protein [Haladaptatus litoreus]SIR69557.1 Protein of unknown function [Haladaptatus litoreus]
MLIADGDDHYRFITQPDHAQLAGMFAEHWGNDTFERPTPFAAMVLVAANHDDGWWEYDRTPHLGDDGIVDFVSVPATEWIEFYDDGISTVVGMNRYSGLVASMHGSGLRRRRYGLSASWPDTPTAFKEFVDREERRQAKLADELHGANGSKEEQLSDEDISVLTTLHEQGEPPENTDSRLWCNYELLQVWDALSLIFGTSESPAETTIESVPTAPGEEISVTVRPVSDGEFELDPYPFAESPLTVFVPARIVRKGDYDTEDDLRRAYYSGEYELVEFTLRA